MYKNSVKKSINFSAENLHLYHYAGNNPIRYTDPTGMSDVCEQTRYFNQYDFADDFSNEFANNACCATSILNVVSNVYTNTTGKALTKKDAVKMIDAAIKNESINSENANVNDLEKAVNAMKDVIELDGTFTCNEINPAYAIYAFSSFENPKKARHFSFVLNKTAGVFLDSAGGKTKILVQSFLEFSILPYLLWIKPENLRISPLQEGRPLRGFDYKKEEKK